MFGIGTALAGLGINFVKDLIADKGEDLVKKGIKKITGVDLDAKPVEELTEVERASIIAAEKELKELDYRTLLAKNANTANARDMQKTALTTGDKFSKRFVYILASFWSLFASCYIVAITFLTIPEASTRFADTILGFLLGTIIATMINYFYGSADTKDINKE